MRVYCKNCKYCYWTDESSYGGDFCCSLIGEQGRNFYRTFTIHGKCEDRNKNNNCKMFWRKLFTIMVKEA